MRDLQILLDKQSITERLYDYARGADRIDLNLIRALFHPDAEADYGSMFTGTGYEFADYIAVAHPPLQTHTHHLSNIRIQVDGDRAGSETYTMARLRMQGPDGSLIDVVSTGRYLDEWERLGGEWRVSRRRYLHSADESRPVAGARYPVGGSRDREDPSYAVLAAE